MMLYTELETAVHAMIQRLEYSFTFNPSLLTIPKRKQHPITLTADHVAAALGISRANAYILLRSDGFPTLHIGKRMVVPKDRFLQWITDSVTG